MSAGGLPRVELRLFLTLWLACALFYSGGGWNQNARFAQIRSLAETGRAWIDDDLVYSVAGRAGADRQLERTPIVDGGFERGGVRYALSWETPDGLVPVAGAEAAKGARRVAPIQVAASGDLTWSGGHLYPNKAPGTSFAGLIPYLVARRIESWAKLDADRWWILTLNAWWTTAACVGLAAALGGVLFFRICTEWTGGDRSSALLATLAFALGTSWWPQATLLQEQVPSAVLLMAAAWAAGCFRPGAEVSRGRLAAAGCAAAAAVATSYLAVLGVAILGAFLWVRHRRDRGWLPFALGAGAGLLPLVAYHVICFGGPLTTGYSGQNPTFRTAGAWLGVLEPPSLSRLAMLLVSPYRGLLVASPVLVAALYGLALAWRERGRRAQVLLAVGLASAFLLFNVCFTGWHGGWSSGPRYLLPAIPFLALGLPFALRRRPRLFGALAALSIAVQLLIVGVDPQSPVGSSSLARIPGRALWRHSPLFDHVLPLFLGGEAPGRLSGAMTGPVSAQPIGIFEGFVGQIFRPGSREARWASFNAGELLLPGSRWSLALVGALVLGAAVWTWRGCRGVGTAVGADRREPEDEDRAPDPPDPLSPRQQGAP